MPEMITPPPPPPRYVSAHIGLDSRHYLTEKRRSRGGLVSTVHTNVNVRRITPVVREKAGARS